MEKFRLYLSLMLKISTDFSPPLGVVIPFFLSGVLFYLLFCLGLVFSTTSFDTLNNVTLALAHLFMVGFVMITIVGAMAQMIPVILEVGHKYLLLYRYIFWFLFAGIGFLVCGFLFSSYMLIFGGISIFCGLLLYVIETILTISRAKKITFYTTVIIVSHLFLIAGLVVGLIMAGVMFGIFDFTLDRLLFAHIFLIVVGFVLNIIIVLTLILLPMFSLAHGFRDIYAKGSFYIFVVATIFAVFGLEKFSLYLLLFGLAIFLVQISLISSKRVRKGKDIWYKSLLISFISLPLFIIFEILNNHLLSGFVLGFGFIGFLIIAHLYKIIPFLVWFERFAPLVGKQKVPMLAQMVSKKEANIQFLFSSIGFGLMILGLMFSSITTIKSGASFASFGAVFLIIGILKIINFK